ncbi:hypothetical protein B1A_06327, partial [mine drainage metagenome]
LKRGLITVAGARNYGVVLNQDFSLDEDATAELRSQLLKSRPGLEVFNRGGEIVDLKERCEAETGLIAPIDPVFT